MRYLRYLIPLAAFVVLTGFLMKGCGWIHTPCRRH